MPLNQVRRVRLRSGRLPESSCTPGWTAINIGIGDHDLVIVGGGVAGYVAAIKAGQEGLKVR